MKKLAVFVVSALAFTACGASDEGATVTGVWARATAPSAPVGAIYFDLTVDEDDTLVGASVPDDISPTAEIHEVLPADSGDDMDMSEDTSEQMSGEMDDMEMSEGSDAVEDMGDMEMSGDMGAMVMQEMPGGLALTAGETVSFEPGSYHVMLTELVDQLEVGEEFDLTLDFENADDVTVTVEVAETAP